MTEDENTPATEAQPAEAQPPVEAQPAETERPTEGTVTCALTGKEIDAKDAYWAPPLITAWQLVSTVGNTFVKAPGNLGHILFEELPEVPYDPEAREELASRRTAEQLKLLGGLVVVLAVIIGIIYLIFSG
jgi:hypothetical protein